VRGVSRTRRNRRAVTSPIPQIIAQIPQQGQTGGKLGSNITMQLSALWLERMSAADRRTVLARQKAWLTQISPGALRVLDEIIIRQAVTLGWRIELSEWVLWRQSEWVSAPDGLGLLRRFHRSIERAARIHQGLEKPPLDDPGIYSFKRETVKELNEVLGKMREARRVHSRHAYRDSDTDLVARFLNLIKRKSRTVPNLARNWHRWKKFLSERSAELRVCLTAARARPASLFDSWFSWCKGVDQEWVRQTISRLGSSPKKPAAGVKLYGSARSHL